jgi:hypothetical protein
MLAADDRVRELRAALGAGAALASNPSRHTTRT